MTETDMDSQALNRHTQVVASVRDTGSPGDPVFVAVLMATHGGRGERCFSRKDCDP